MGGRLGNFIEPKMPDGLDVEALVTNMKVVQPLLLQALELGANPENHKALIERLL
jgi:hypothetical protein